MTSIALMAWMALGPGVSAQEPRKSEEFLGVLVSACGPGLSASIFTDGQGKKGVVYHTFGGDVLLDSAKLMARGWVIDAGQEGYVLQGVSGANKDIRHALRFPMASEAKSILVELFMKRDEIGALEKTRGALQRTVRAFLAP